MNNQNQMPPPYGMPYGGPGLPYPPPVLLQENGAPVVPEFRERRWIKRVYGWTGGVLLIQVGIAFFVSMLIVAGGMIANSGRFGIGSLLQNTQGLLNITVYATVFSYLAANIGAFFIGCKSQKLKMGPLFHWNRSSGKMIVGAIVLALGVQAAVQLSSTAFINLLDYATGVDFTQFLPSLETNGGAAEILMTVYICIIAPVTEELLFRGFCLKNLSRVNVRLGIFGSAFLFGLIHGNIVQFVLAFVLGILLAHITVKSGSIFPAMLVHFVVNSSATLLDYIAELNPFIGNSLSWIWYIFFLLAGAAVLIVARKVYHQRLPEKTLARKKRGWGLFFSSATIVINLCIYGLMIVLPLLMIPFLSMFASLLNRSGF